MLLVDRTRVQPGKWHVSVERFKQGARESQTTDRQTTLRTTA